MNDAWQSIIDELRSRFSDSDQALGAAAQMVVSARADAEYWKQLAREFREERDHAEERLLNKGGVE